MDIVNKYLKVWVVHCVVAGSVLAQRGRNPLLDEPSPPRRQSRPSLATVLEDPRLASLLLEDSRLSGLLEDSRLDAVNFEGRETSLLDELLAAGRPRGRGRAFADVMSLLRATPEFSVLAKALELTDLADSLEAGGPFTVFAPTNRAFDRVRGGRDKMLANVDSLRRTVLRHIVRARLSSLSVPHGVSQVDTAAGDKLTIASLSGRLAIYNCEGAAEVDITDLYSDNGIVHSVDTVL